jgi:hypothetical protein
MTMNERIKELKDQCYISIIDQNGDNEYDMEKFAQLIVRECVQVVNAADDSCEDYYGTIIKEHFGVKK